MSQKAAAAVSEAKVAPDLIKALDEKKAGSSPLAVVYQLQGTAGCIVPPPEQVDAIVKRILATASKTAKIEPEKQNIFRRLGSFVVLGDRALHRAMLQQPGIGAAVLNQSAPAKAEAGLAGRVRKSSAGAH